LPGLRESPRIVDGESPARLRSRPTPLGRCSFFALERMPLFVHRRDRIWGRRITAVVSLAGYLLTTVGVPVPASIQKERGVAYPCQHHACGCTSAAECWNNCCCYSTSQKLAWAREHNVTPPAQLLAAEEHEHDESGDHDAHVATASSQAQPKSCCAKNAAHAEPAGASCVADDCSGHVRVSDADRQASRVTFVSWVMARKCRGLAEYWCLSGAALPPPSLVTWQFQWDVVERIAYAGATHVSGEDPPPVPPPQA
jgi:hypothetical protein